MHVAVQVFWAVSPSGESAFEKKFSGIYAVMLFSKQLYGRAVCGNPLKKCGGCVAQFFLREGGLFD